MVVVVAEVMEMGLGEVGLGEAGEEVAVGVMAAQLVAKEEVGGMG